MSTHKQLVPEVLRIVAAREAKAMLDEVNGVQAVVVATIDGFDIASASRTNVDPQRIAATASSIAAISAVVSAETNLGRNRSIIIDTDTDSGFAVVYSVQADVHQLVIDVVADKSAVIGQVVYRTAHFARTLTRT